MRLVVGITGATGTILGVRLLEASQAPHRRGGHGGTTRTFVDATTPFTLAATTRRSFP